MPRISREELLCGSEFSHIVIQGIAKEYIFESGMLKNLYLKLLREEIEKNNVELIAYCVMGNHAHLLLKAEEPKRISLTMKNTNAKYALKYNGLKKRVGYVFRNRFRGEAITSEAFLISCIAYIHNNPVKARIVEIAEEYEFSSAKLYLQGKGLFKIEDQKAIEINFLDDEYEGKVEYDNIAEEIFVRYNIKNTKTLQDKEILRKIVLEIRERTGISLREIAELLEINREAVRKAVSKPTSP